MARRPARYTMMTGTMNHRLAYERVMDIITDPAREPAFTYDEVSLWVITQMLAAVPGSTAAALAAMPLYWDYVRAHVEEQNDVRMFPLGAYYFSNDRLQDQADKVDDWLIWWRSLAGLCGGRTVGLLAVNSRSNLGLVLTKLVRKKITTNGSAEGTEIDVKHADNYLPIKAADYKVLTHGLKALVLQNGAPKRIKI